MTCPRAAANGSNSDVHGDGLVVRQSLPPSRPRRLWLLPAPGTTAFISFSAESMGQK